MTTATSSSDRYEAARAALTEYRGPDVYTVHSDNPSERYDVLDAAEVLAAALRSLIEPPATEETAGEIANRLVSTYEWPYSERREFRADELAEVLEEAVHAGIQAAHESWEPDAYAEAPTLSREFIEGVTGTTLTVAQYSRVLGAVPHSSIPEALGVIVQAVTA